MKITLRRGIILATLAVLALCVPISDSRAEKRLTWEASGRLEAIGTDSITVSGFHYKLTSTTVYEKANQHTTLSAFVVGDTVEVTFLTDRSVIELEGKESGGSIVTNTPTPVATPQASKFSVRLAPLGSSVAQGQGAATYKSLAGTFTLKVTIPQNTIPLVTTIAEARALSVTATITRKGTGVATCRARFESKRRHLSVYEFKTEVERKPRYGTTKTRSKRGRCVLANDRTGLPTIKAGDVMTVSEATAGEFLTGKF